MELLRSWRAEKSSARKGKLLVGEYRVANVISLSVSWVNVRGKSL